MHFYTLEFVLLNWLWLSSFRCNFKDFCDLIVLFEEYEMGCDI